MSRLAKKPIMIPEKVEVKQDGDNLTITGPLGTLSRNFKRDIKITVVDGSIQVETTRNSLDVRALVGTYASLIKNMIKCVTEGFTKKLIIEGTGYRAKLSGNSIILSLGYSHDVPMEVPEGIKAEVKDETLTLTGTDNELVGQFAANIRAKRPPEPYKGKGVRYSDEVIERKQGKKAVT